jgi:hypothetical protein
MKADHSTAVLFHQMNNQKHAKINLNGLMKLLLPLFPLAKTGEPTPQDSKGKHLHPLLLNAIALER